MLQFPYCNLTLLISKSPLNNQERFRSQNPAFDTRFNIDILFEQKGIVSFHGFTLAISGEGFLFRCRKLVVTAKRTLLKTFIDQFGKLRSGANKEGMKTEILLQFILVLLSCSKRLDPCIP